MRRRMLDLRIVGQRDETLLEGIVRPERSVHIVRNQPRINLMPGDVGEETGLTQQLGKRGSRRARRRGNGQLEYPARLITDEQVAVSIRVEIRDLRMCAGDLLVFRYALLVIPRRP